MVGDQDDITGRLKRLLPPWFGPDGAFPAVEAFAAGAAKVLAGIYDLWAFAKLQTRIATSTGGWLELTAADFIDAFPRFPGESDAAYSRRIRLEIFRPRNTRRGIDRAVFDLTGDHPDIFEAWRPGDCGGYGVPSAMGYGVAGLYGSGGARFEVIVSTPQLRNYGIPNRPGYGATFIGYGGPTWGYADDNDLVGSGPKIADVLAALKRVRMAGITYYLRFTQLGDPTPGSQDHLSRAGPVRDGPTVACAAGL
jgi:hypothetical protein